jgi:hypothetical protein
MKGDYKEAEAAVEKLKAGDVRGVEPAIHYLKADVYESGSGYLKEYLWRYLPRAPLTERQKERLLQVARNYLGRQMGREFWQMCRAAGQIADAEFGEYVRNLAVSAKGEAARQRAALLAAYLAGLEEGERARRRFTRKVRYGEDGVTSDEA